MGNWKKYLINEFELTRVGTFTTGGNTGAISGKTAEHMRGLAHPLQQSHPGSSGPVAAGCGVRGARLPPAAAEASAARSPR